MPSISSINLIFYLLTCNCVYSEYTDFILTYKGNTTTNTGPYLQFSDAFEPSNIINININITRCRNECIINNNCSGYITYINSDSNIESCNQLYSINNISTTTLNSKSYTKIIDYSHNYNHSLVGITAFIGRNSENSTVYIDLNHNGELDLYEPNITTNEYFYFDNLKPGHYVVKEEKNINCVGLLPDVFGYIQPSLYENITEFNNIAYVNHVDNFKHYTNIIYGGNTNTGELNETLYNLDYLTDYDNNTFVKFQKTDRLVVSFTNDTILNRDGYDIEFVLIQNTTLQANISVSTMNIHDLQFLGVLNNTNQEFDLSTINYTYPVYHIFIDIFGNTNDTINIASIVSRHALNYEPYHSFYLSTPFDNTIAFISDCNYNYNCEDFCDLSMYSWDDFLSCNLGCALSLVNLTCDCSSVDYNYTELHYVNELYNRDFPDIFLEDKCYDGCKYNINRYLYPNYTYGIHGIGNSQNVIHNSTMCSSMLCVDDIIDTCNNLNCSSFSLNNNNNYNIEFYD